MSTHAARSPLPKAEAHAGPGLAIASVLLGILVAVVGFFALFTWLDAKHAKDAANRAAASAAGGGQATGSMPGIDANTASTSGALTSYAGAAPANADTLAAAHKAFPAQLPAAPAGPV